MRCLFTLSALPVGSEFLQYGSEGGSHVVLLQPTVLHNVEPVEEVSTLICEANLRPIRRTLLVLHSQDCLYATVHTYISNIVYIYL